MTSSHRVPPLSPQSRPYDLIICDIDGCLSPEGTAPIHLDHLAKISAYNHEAVATANAPPITLCSGRPQPFGEAMCKILGIAQVPCVFENGAWLYRLDTNQYELDPSITDQHLADVQALSRWVSTEFGTPPGTAAERQRTVGVTQQPGKIASVSLYHPDTEYLRSLMPALAEQCRRAGWPIRVSMTWLYINLDLAHISKGTGLDRLLREAKIPKDRIAGIGDTMSDLPIRERSAYFACPANAHEDIKRLADYVSPLPEAAGVVDILTRLNTRVA
ncbi:MAG: HAD family phosphatase [Pyrinomonadaceae bacterium]|nr:HAD family phosphatase [Phycisphaerales bacterium]